VNGEIVQTPIRKYYPPDTTAAIFWLKNRRKETWRDKTESVITNKYEGLSEQELDDKIKKLASGQSAET